MKRDHGRVPLLKMLPQGHLVWHLVHDVAAGINLIETEVMRGLELYALDVAIAGITPQ